MDKLVIGGSDNSMMMPYNNSQFYSATFQPPFLFAFLYMKSATSQKK